MNTRTRTQAPAGAAKSPAAKSSTLDKTADLGASTDMGADLAKAMGVQLATDTAATAGPMIFSREHTPDIDTGDTDMGIHDRSIDLANDFDIYALRDQLNAGATDLGNPLMKHFVETLDFMNELVLVRVSPTAEADAPRIVEVWNDGTPQRFIRDAWVVAKRKYVEVLARSLPFSVTTPEGLDGRGDKTRRLETHTGQRFPFEMKDRNPIGMNWLNRLFMERG